MSHFLEGPGLVWARVSQTFNECLWKSAKRYSCKMHLGISVKCLSTVSGTLILLWIWPQITLISLQIGSCESNWFFTSLAKLKKELRITEGMTNWLTKHFFCREQVSLFTFSFYQFEWFWKENTRIHYFLQFPVAKMIPLFCYFTEFWKQIQSQQNIFFFFLVNKLFSQKKLHDCPQLAVGKAKRPLIHIGPLKIFIFAFVLCSKALVINRANPPGSGQWDIALATSTPEPGEGSWHMDLRWRKRYPEGHRGGHWVFQGPCWVGLRNLSWEQEVPGQRKGLTLWTCIPCRTETCPWGESPRKELQGKWSQAEAGHAETQVVTMSLWEVWIQLLSPWGCSEDKFALSPAAC